VAWIALGVSICAALFTGISALVNWWNRADKKRVSLVLVGSLVEVFSRSSPRTRTEELWTLHNAGEGSILTPTARVEGPFGETYSLAGSGALNGHGRLVMKAARDAPPMADVFWSLGSATVSWHEGGRLHEVSAKVLIESSQRIE